MPLYMPIAEISLDAILLALLGYSVGILSGLFGVGGGFLITPSLIFLGVPSLVAVGTGALQVIAASVSGALRQWHQGNVDMKLGGFLIAGGLIGATSGAQLQRLLKSIGQLDLFVSLIYVLLLGTIGSLMLIEGISAWRGTAKNGASRSVRRAGQHTMLQRLPLRTRFPASKLHSSVIPPILAGVIVGWLTAIMGVGGGFLLVPALIYVIRVPTRTAMGTSALQIIFVTAFNTLLQSTQNFNIDIVLAAPIVAGAVIGAQQGASLGSRINSEQLRILMALLVLVIGLRMGIDLVRKPADLYSLEVGPLEVLPDK